MRRLPAQAGPLRFSRPNRKITCSKVRIAKGSPLTGQTKNLTAQFEKLVYHARDERRVKAGVGR
jgi:hypothetical protein